MAFCYDLIDTSGRLSQGELLFSIQEPLLDTGAGTGTFTIVPHDMCIVLTPDCDLLSDFLYRYPDEVRQQKNENVKQSNLLNNIILCDAYVKEVVKPVVGASDLWRRVENNQDSRFQHIPGGPQGPDSGDSHPDLYVDFKRLFTLPPNSLYESIQDGHITRGGILPNPWVFGLVTRLFEFQGRICLPDPSDDRIIVNQPRLLPGKI